MLERKMGNRGSKSTVGAGLNSETANKKMKLAFPVVKEQRVDGKLLNFNNSCLGLRCILKGFERNYQIRIHSKSINKFSGLRAFSTSTMKNKVSLLSPSFIVGFADGEGTFSVTLVKDKSYKLGWQVKPKFSIGLHKKDLSLLESIHSSLGVGGISSQGVNGVQFSVNSIKDRRILTDFFDKYPLLTKKRADYQIFKAVLELMENKVHLTQDGLQKIVALKGILNTGFLSKELRAAFSDLCLVEKEPILLPGKISDFWLAGFTSAEGSFMVRTSNSSGRTLGIKVQLEFNLTQHMRDEQLMKDIANFFNCGSVYLNRETYVYRVVSLSNILEKIIPFYQKYPIQGVKAKDFVDFVKVAELMKENKHLTLEGLEEINLIKSGMNSFRI